ncbi:MAG: hypothetical protein ABIT09_06595 [Croceibacterium sp.]
MATCPPPFANAAEPWLPLPEVPSLDERWTALADAARAIAELADNGRDSGRNAAGDPVAPFDGAAPWRRAKAAEYLDDLSAIMRAGLAALLAIRASGRDPAIAAGALLQEFADARAALHRLIEPPA